MGADAGKPTTLLCGLRVGGLVAPLVLDGATTGAAFLAYIEQFLAPTLAKDDSVVLDNLGSHIRHCGFSHLGQ